MAERRIVISNFTIVIAVAIFLLLMLLWQLKSLLVVLMIAVVLASTLAPIIQAGEKLNIPRWLAVILAYLGLISIITGIGLIIGPTVVKQIQRLASQFPSYLNDVEALVDNLAIRLGMTEPIISEMLNTQTLVSWSLRSSRELLVRSYGVTRGILGGFFTILLAVLLSAYMLAGSKMLIRGIVSLFPQPWDERLEAQVIPVSRRMGGYIQGRVVVSAILASTVAIGLGFLGLSDFAVGLGVIAGVTNLIPFFGPVLGSIPALIVAIPQGGFTFLGVLLLFVVIQNLETYVLDPLLVGNSVKVPPLYQLLAVLGGVQVLGIVGALIVPPWVAGAAVVLENLYLKPKLLREKVGLPDSKLEEGKLGKQNQEVGFRT